MSTVKGDPVDWTVEEVIKFLCHSSETPWSQSVTPPPRPAPNAFEAVLRENMITGEVLLNDVDKETLRDDLGLKPIGHRSSILMAIRYLRQISSKYQHSQSVYPSTVMEPVSQAPAPHEDANSTPVTDSTERSSKEYRSIDLLPPSNLLVGQRYIPPGLRHEDEEAGSGKARSKDAAPGVLHKPRHPEECRSAEFGPNIRPGEHFIVGSDGRKRRRLPFDQLSESRTNQHASRAIDVSPNRTWYMGLKKVSLPDIFYPLAADEDNDSFMIVSSRLPAAHTLFVSKALTYFYRQRPFKLRCQSGDSQWALLPYNSEKIHKSSSKFFTLYTSRDDNVSVTQENMDNWPQFDKQHAAEPIASVFDPFSYLLQKYPTENDNENVYPLYGDSDFEDYDSDTLQEMEAERDSPPKRRLALSQADVYSIIEQAIEQYKSEWNQDHRPREEQKARRLWRMARKERCTNQKIHAITHQVGHLNGRLKKIIHEIRMQESESKGQLRVLCRAMEETVFQIQRENFRISILEQGTCPSRVTVTQRPRQMPKTKTAEDEESLNSGSEDFIVDDDSSDGSQIGSFENPEVAELPKLPDVSTISSDDDAIIPSVVRQKLRKRKLISPPPPPARQEGRDTAESPIDLTEETPVPDDLKIETPPLNPVRQSATSSCSTTSGPAARSSVSPAPDSLLGTSFLAHDSVPARGSSEVSNRPSSMTIEVSRQYSDRCMLLADLVSTLSAIERKHLAESVYSYDVERLQGLVRDALYELLWKPFDSLSLKHNGRKTVVLVLSLFLSWINNRRRGIQGVTNKHVHSALDGIDRFPMFYRLLCERLELGDRRQNSSSGRGATGVQGSGMQSSSHVPHKKRKREVRESQEAKRRQENAMRRVALQDEQRKALEEKMANVGVINSDPNRLAVSFRAPTIYLDPYIGQRIKPHQLKGVQFMWRELIEDEKQQGCLLAHTMGLGKTMQVISLLATISAASASSDDNISQQVPRGLRESKTLIICPSSLIENWFEEFIMWTPRHVDIGRVRKITSAQTLPERLHEAFEWERDGGILILSYNIFQALVNNSATKIRKKPLEDDVHQRVKDCIIDGPNIIVADEAHKMKNPASRAAIAAKQFRSKRRIALTGSPLANNLVDYFTMVDWIAPGYLGEFLEFKANYEEPIKEGLYAESTNYERRKSLVKLQVLKEILDPKINRADIMALEKDLPPKVEFVITVSLTDLQRRAYDAYVESLLQGKGDADNARLWSWLAILGLCCNHPVCFWDKLQNRADDATKVVKDDVDVMPGDEPIAQTGLPERVIAREEELFAAIPDIRALDLSYRAQILERIIALSIKAGDKVLVFSHSLPTLSYIEYVLQASGYKYCRLDGQTPMHGRQAATKQFNNGCENMVYLISTRAGGLGLNIAGASRVVIFDFKFSPMWEEQAVGRAYRLGQRKPVFVYRFIAGGTFEEVIYNKAVFKTQLAFRVVDKKNPVRWASKSLGEYLFPVKPVKQMDVSEYIGKDPHVLDQILKHDQGSIRKIALTETFQKEGDDKLTEDDRKDVQRQLSDERLRRSDPIAYERLISERRPQTVPSVQRLTFDSGYYPWSATTPQYQAFSHPLDAYEEGTSPTPRSKSSSYFATMGLPLNSIQPFQLNEPDPSHALSYPVSAALGMSMRPGSQPPAETGVSKPNPLTEEPSLQQYSYVPGGRQTNSAPPRPEIRNDTRRNARPAPLSSYAPKTLQTDGHTIPHTGPTS